MAKETRKVRNIKNLLTFSAEARQLAPSIPPSIQSLSDSTNLIESSFQHLKRTTPTELATLEPVKLSGVEKGKGA